MKIGSKGNLSEVTRIIKVIMYDNYYEPSSFQIKAGETIKFEVKNAGKLVHEFNIANKMMHMKHQPEMEMMVANEILFADFIDYDKMKKMAKIATINFPTTAEGTRFFFLADLIVTAPIARPNAVRRPRISP